MNIQIFLWECMQFNWVSWCVHSSDIGEFIVLLIIFHLMNLFDLDCVVEWGMTAQSLYYHIFENRVDVWWNVLDKALSTCEAWQALSGWTFLNLQFNVRGTLKSLMQYIHIWYMLRIKLWSLHLCIFKIFVRFPILK